jgi:hypothetical protein
MGRDIPVAGGAIWEKPQARPARAGRGAGKPGRRRRAPRKAA